MFVEIEKFISIQKLFDTQHGWSLKNGSTKEKLEYINKDLIGLFGEIGEFSNLIKKLNLLAGRDNLLEFELTFKDKQSQLEEELIDSFIYILRIATHLEVDITKTYLNKMNINKKRFEKYENINEKLKES
jgi:NTP pyrophosphatase (non-canonical NTP hydrolase)